MWRVGGARASTLFVMACVVVNSVVQECQAWMKPTTTSWAYSTRQGGGSSSSNGRICYNHPTTSNRAQHTAMCLVPQQLGTFEPLTLSPPSSSDLMDAQEIKQDDRFVILEDFVSAPTIAPQPQPPTTPIASNGVNGSSDLWIPNKQQQQARQPLLPFQQGWDIQKELSLEHRQRLDRLRLHDQPAGSAAATREQTMLSPFLDKKTATEWQQQQQQRSFAKPTEKTTQQLTLMQQQQQQQQERDILRGGLDTILFVQHEPVYTLGGGSDASLILNNNDNDEIPIVRMNRGGEVTYHGPGMLVVYPVLDLRNYRKDIHWYMRALEEAVLLALQDVGIQGAMRDEETTGVWIRDGKDNDLYKVAAIGIHCRQWITQHGLAINVEHHPCNRAFEGIVPCGLHGRKVGCVNQFLDEKHAITLEQMASSMVAALEEVFRIKLVTRPLI